MKKIEKEYYKYLCCPQCSSDLDLTIKIENSIGIKSGYLVCENCSKIYPILHYIPRFVERENYASSFGFEWNKYSKLRSDIYNNTNIIQNTILRRSGWSDNHLKGKLLLECGCGAGNDTEVLLNLGAKVISFDYSNSVDSAFENNKNRENLLILQADIYNIPLKKKIFDIVYCHRVIQHTPKPEKAFYSIIEYAKPGGEVFLHSYAIRLWHQFHWKNILRVITKRLKFQIIHSFLKIIGPILYPLKGFILKSKEIKGLKCTLIRLVPFDNFKVGLANSSLTKKEKYHYSLLNVFDALTPKFDNPNSAKTILNWFKSTGFNKIKIRGIDPVIIIAFKQ